MIDDWLAHMNWVSSLLDGEKPRLIHWSYAEPVDYEEEYDSARERHPDKGWPAVNWFDLWARVVRKEPVAVRGALNFGLKSFARALHSHGLIETSLGGYEGRRPRGNDGRVVVRRRGGQPRRPFDRY